MKRRMLMVLVWVLMAGCSNKTEEQLNTLLEQQQALSARLAELERRLATREVTGASDTAPAVSTSIDNRAGETLTLASSEIVAALAAQINTLVQETVVATIDARIASQVGTAEDIEEIFAQVVEDEMAAKAAAEQDARAAQRREQTAEWDTRSIERRATAAGLDASQQQAVLTARQAMRQRLREQLPELKVREATLSEMLTAVGEARTTYEAELAKTLTPDALSAFESADWWRERQQRQVDELAATLTLEAEQKALVDDAYTVMRVQMADGFLLMSEGYLEPGAARQGAQTARESLSDSLRTILTPDQFQTYEATSRSGRGQ
ncbi:MAG: hypothetical protein O3A51_08020, partial [Verrucomicrobia bacterium]|nr:hypothetical protein [Verrucomicrobiota bacterium]